MFLLLKCLYKEQVYFIKVIIKHKVRAFSNCHVKLLLEAIKVTHI